MVAYVKNPFIFLSVLLFVLSILTSTALSAEVPKWQPGFPKVDNNEKILLIWSPVKKASGYKVYRNSKLFSWYKKKEFKPIILSRKFGISIYTLAKTYHKLPSEIIKSSTQDWIFNMGITGIGFEDDMKNEYISMLDSINIKIRPEDRDKYTIKQLQMKWEQNKKRGFKHGK